MVNIKNPDFTEKSKAEPNVAKSSVNNGNIESNENIPNRQCVPFLKLFRFTNGFDKIIIFFMIASSIAVGVAYPLNIYVFKDVINILVTQTVGVSYVTLLTDLIIRFFILSIATFIAAYIQMICISLTASRQSRRYKSEYFYSLLRQEISWFDKQQTGQMITKLSDDIESIEISISDKLAQFIQQISLFTGSILISLFCGWKLTLVGLTAVPIMGCAFFLMIHFIKKYSIAQVRAYSIAGGIAEEILSSIQTVVAFNAQEKEVKRYTLNLCKAERLGIKRSICLGLGIGCTGSTVFSCGSLVFYVGLQLIAYQGYEPGAVIQS